MKVRLDTLVRLCRAKERLCDCGQEQWTIPALAREAAVSPYHFIRLFQAVFGETPHQLRTRARLDRARELLVASDGSITDICMQVGFSSLGSFSRLFSRHVGESPSAYRRRMRPWVRVRGVPPARMVPGCFDLMWGVGA